MIILRRQLTIICAILVIAAVVFTSCGKSTKKDVPINVNVTDAMAIQTKVDGDLKKEVESGYKMDNPFVALNPYGNAPLSAILIFKTDNETGVKIKIKGHDSSTDIVNKFPITKDHIIPIYGLYAGEENTVIITTNDGTTKEVKITTEGIKSSLSRAVAIKADKAEMENGLTFISPAAVDPSGISGAAYDSNGELRWVLKGHAPLWAIRRLENGRLIVSSDRDAGKPYYTMGVREIDLMGKTYAEYVVPGGNHHDVRELPNGNLLIGTEEHGAKTVEDVAVEVDRNTGAIVKTFDLRKVIPMDDGGSLIATANDWYHNNAIWYDSKTNSVLFSGRHVNTVIALDYSTGKLKWILGDPEGWSKAYQKYFFKPIGNNFEWQYAQHAAMVTPEGYIFLFDNGVSRAKKTNENKKLTSDQNYSRAVMYEINEKNMTVKQIWQYGKELGASWYSSFISDVDYLSKGHYLIESGGKLYDTAKKTYDVNLADMAKPSVQKTASIVELKDNKKIFELKVDSLVYRAERITPYDKENNFDLDATGSVLGQLNKETFITDMKIPSTELPTPAFLKISAVQEPDRVIVNGTWNAGKLPKDTKLLLKSTKDDKYLGLQVPAPNPTPAVDKPVAFSKWAATLGLNGQYEIYLLADGVLYNTSLSFEIK